MNKNNISSNGPVPSCQEYTLNQYVNAVKDMINFQSFDYCDRTIVNSFCRIIANVFRLDPDVKISINKKEIKAKDVQEVYYQLDERHIELVSEKFKEQNREIKCLTSYVRTMLFNSVAELALINENRANVDEE